MKRKLVLALVLMFFGVASLVGCSSKLIEEAEVYTSFYPIHMAVKEIAGEEVKVASVMPLDKSAHFWEPSAKDLERLGKAKVLFINGANMEPWVEKVQEVLPNLKIINLSESLPREDESGKIIQPVTYAVSHLALKSGETYELTFGHTHEKSLDLTFYEGSLSREALPIEVLEKRDDKQAVSQKLEFLVEPEVTYQLEMVHNDGKIAFRVPRTGEWTVVFSEKSGERLPYALLNANSELDITPSYEVETSLAPIELTDPHTFLSVGNVKNYARSISKTLSEAYPEKARAFKDNEAIMLRNLTKLEHEYQDKFKGTSQKTFLVTHGAFGYLAKEFGLVQYAVQDPNAEGRASLKVIKEAILFAKKEKINTIFYERGGDERSADTVSLEIGGKSEFLETLEYLPGDRSDDVTYADLLKENLEKIYQSLEGTE